MGKIYDAAARTFYCHACQCEQPITDKVKTGKSSVRCRTCLQRAKTRANVGSIYSSHPSSGGRSWGREEIPEVIMDAYKDSLEEW